MKLIKSVWLLPVIFALVFFYSCSKKESQSDSSGSSNNNSSSTQVALTEKHSKIVIKGFYLGMPLKLAYENAVNQFLKVGISELSIEQKYSSIMGCFITKNSLELISLYAGNKERQLSKEEEIAKAMIFIFETANEILYQYSHSNNPTNFYPSNSLFEKTDLWGNILKYNSIGKRESSTLEFTLSSDGPDMISGNNDDIIFENENFKKSPFTIKKAKSIVDFIPCNCNDPVSRIIIPSYAVNILFNVSDMSAENFVQNFIDSYSIPEMTPEYKNNTSYWTYTSFDGYKISIDTEKTIYLESIATKKERKFD